jgi:hypothetical protein
MEVIDSEVLAILNSVLPKNSKQALLESELIGQNQILDSFGLLEFCIRLEDYSQTKGFLFDWTSNISMSLEKSYFRTVETLIQELKRQAQK